MILYGQSAWQGKKTYEPRDLNRRECAGQFAAATCVQRMGQQWSRDNTQPDAEICNASHAHNGTCALPELRQQQYIPQLSVLSSYALKYVSQLVAIAKYPAAMHL